MRVHLALAALYGERGRPGVVHTEVAKASALLEGLIDRCPKVHRPALRNLYRLPSVIASYTETKQPTATP